MCTETKEKNMSSSSTSSVENSPLKKMASLNQEKEVSDTVLHLKSIMDRLDNLFKSSDFTSAVSSVVENVFSPISDKMEFDFAKIHKRLDETENKQLTIEIENSDLRKDNDKLNEEINGLKEKIKHSNAMLIPFSRRLMNKNNIVDLKLLEYTVYRRWQMKTARKKCVMCCNKN